MPVSPRVLDLGGLRAGQDVRAALTEPQVEMLFHSGL